MFFFLLGLLAVVCTFIMTSVCREFSILVSGSGGFDCSCIIWDLNTLSYVRTLDQMTGPLVAVAVSKTTVSEKRKEKGKEKQTNTKRK